MSRPPSDPRRWLNRNGERFTNEAAPYVDVVVAMYADQKKTGATVPGWMVFDGRYRRNYIAGPVGPGKVLADSSLGKKPRNQFLVKASTVEGLAAKIEVPADRLKVNGKSWNATETGAPRLALGNAPGGPD